MTRSRDLQCQCKPSVEPCVAPCCDFVAISRKVIEILNLNRRGEFFREFKIWSGYSDSFMVCCLYLKRRLDVMSTRKLLTNGNAFKRTDNRWGGVVWYMDEQGERKRKSFSVTTKAEVNKKMTEYIAAFNDSIIESQETKKRLRDSMQNWLEVFKFPSVERTTYDRYECTAKNQSIRISAIKYRRC